MEGGLDTERLRLYPLTEDDLDDLVELDGEPEVRRMADPAGVIIPADREERRTYEWERHVAPGGFYGARERVGHAFVGWFQLERVPDRPDEVELGYRLRRNVWGLGYATEALAAVRDCAAALGLERVYALCHPAHRTSARVLEKAGFLCEGTLGGYAEFPNLAPGVQADVLCYAMRYPKV